MSLAESYLKSEDGLKEAMRKADVPIIPCQPENMSETIFIHGARCVGPPMPPPKISPWVDLVDSEGNLHLSCPKCMAAWLVKPDDSIKCECGAAFTIKGGLIKPQEVSGTPDKPRERLSNCPFCGTPYQDATLHQLHGGLRLVECPNCHKATEFPPNPNLRPEEIGGTHYQQGVKTSPWDLQRQMKSSGSAFVDARRADAIKYAFRLKYDKAGLVEDLKKAKHCLEAAINELEASMLADIASSLKTK